MFSARTRWDLARNRLARGPRGKRRSGVPCSTSPSRTPRAPGSRPRPDLLASLRVRPPCSTSPSRFGLRRAREAVAADYARRGLDVDAGPHPAHREHERGLRLPLQAALRPGRRGAGAAARAIPCSSTWPASSRWRRAVRASSYDGAWHLTASSRSRDGSDPRTRAVVVGEPEQPHRRVPEARRARGAARPLRRARPGPRLRRGVRRLRLRRRPAARGRASPATARPSPSRSAAFRRAARSPSSSWPGCAVTGPEALRARGAGRAWRSWPTRTSPCRRRCSARPPALLARREELQAPVARARRRATSPGCARALAGRSPGDAARARRRLVRRAARPRHAVARRSACSRLLDERRRAGPPRLLLRLPPRGVPGAEPAAASPRSSRRASRRVAATPSCYKKASEVTDEREACLAGGGARLIEKEGYVYVDVRSVPEFEAGHPTGAYNVPLVHMGPAGMSPNPEFLAVMEKAFPKDSKLVVGLQGGRPLAAGARPCCVAAGFHERRRPAGGLRRGRTPRAAEPGWRPEGPADEPRRRAAAAPGTTCRQGEEVSAPRGVDRRPAARARSAARWWRRSSPAARASPCPTAHAGGWDELRGALGKARALRRARRPGRPGRDARRSWTRRRLPRRARRRGRRWPGPGAAGPRSRRRPPTNGTA